MACSLRSFWQLVCFYLLLAAGAAAAEPRTIVVQAGAHGRGETPVSVAIPDDWRGQTHFTLKCLDTGTNVPCQLVPGPQPELVWIIRRQLAAGQSRRYALSVSHQTPNTDGVVVRQDGRALRVSVAGQPVLTYNTALVRHEDRKESYYDRSGYLHPLYNPSGQVVTDDFAPDHPHQHGLMFPWTSTTFEGRPVNFWDQKQGQGMVRHEAVESTREGPVCGEFTVGLLHLDRTTPARPKPVLNETWRIRVYNLSDYFLFDFKSIQRCAGSPLQINQYSYGGLAIRGHRDWLTPGQGDFLTSEGKTRADGNQTRPRWCDINGYIEGARTGVTILGHPDNFRAPQPVRLHPNKPYFCFAPLALGDFRIEPGQPYVSNYRFCIHDGALDPQFAERLWSDLAHPPQVAFE